MDGFFDWLAAVFLLRKVIYALWASIMTALAFMKKQFPDFSYLHMVISMIICTYAMIIGLVLHTQTKQHAEIITHLKNLQNAQHVHTEPVNTLESPLHQERPYFTQTRASLHKQTDGTYTLSLDLQNHGAPATKILMQALVIDHSLDPTRKPVYSRRIDMANPAGSGIIASTMQHIALTPNQQPIFVMFQIRYTDAMSQAPHVQEIFLKSREVDANGKYRPTLVHASKDEKARMERYVKDRGIPTL